MDPKLIEEYERRLESGDKEALRQWLEQYRDELQTALGVSTEAEEEVAEPTPTGTVHWEPDPDNPGRMRQVTK